MTGGQGVYGNAVLYDWSGVPLAGFRQGSNDLLLGYGDTYASESGAWGWDPESAMAITPKSNLITIAPNRSGKGTSVIVPNLLNCKMGMVVTDPKGENAWITARRRLQLGQSVAIIDPFNWVNDKFGNDKRSAAAGLTPLPVTRFNPLSHLQPDSPSFADEVDYLADAMVHYSGQGDPHWVDSAKQLISGLIAFHAQSLGKQASLSLIRDVLTQSVTDLADTIGGMVAQAPNTLASRRLRKFVEAGDSKELGSVINTAVTQTSFLDNDSIRNSTSAHDFDEAAFIGGRMTVYLVLPAEKLKQHNRWLRLILSSLIARLVQRQDTSRKVVFMLDEFGTIGHLQAIEDAFGLFPGYGVHSWIFPQDLSQLKRDYPAGWQNFIANAEVLQAFNIKSLETAEYLSKMVGNTTVAVPVETMKEDHPVTYTGKPVFFPQELMQMAGAHQLVFYNGQPVRGARLDYFSDRYLKDLGTPLPERLNQAAPPPLPPPPKPWPSWVGPLLGTMFVLAIAVVLLISMLLPKGTSDLANNPNIMVLDAPAFEAVTPEGSTLKLEGRIGYISKSGMQRITQQGEASIVQMMQTCARGQVSLLVSMRDFGRRDFIENLTACTHQRVNNRLLAEVVWTELRRVDE